MLVNYYRPKITPIAADGSLKYGVQLKTKIWTIVIPNKMDVTINAETEELAIYELKKFIKHQNFMHEWPAAVITEKSKV
jgi:hypothetical protein